MDTRITAVTGALALAALAAFGCQKTDKSAGGCASGVCAPKSTATAPATTTAPVKAGPAEMNTAALLAMQRAGLKLHDQKPVMMLAPRYRLLLPLDIWTFRFVSEVNWTSNVGWASNATFDVERPLPHDLFFRASNSWIWTEHVKGYLYGIIFSVGQPLGPRRGLSYDWVNVFQTRPINELTEVSLRVNYRQQLWRKWIYFDVSPQYRFPRTNSFNGLPGILFRIEMLLGNYR